MACDLQEMQVFLCQTCGHMRKTLAIIRVTWHIARTCTSDSDFDFNILIVSNYYKPVYFSMIKFEHIFPQFLSNDLLRTTMTCSNILPEHTATLIRWCTRECPAQENMITSLRESLVVPAGTQWQVGTPGGEGTLISHVSCRCMYCCWEPLHGKMFRKCSIYSAMIFYDAQMYEAFTSVVAWDLSVGRERNNWASKYTTW